MKCRTCENVWYVARYFNDPGSRIDAYCLIERTVVEGDVAHEGELFIADPDEWYCADYKGEA